MEVLVFTSLRATETSIFRGVRSLVTVGALGLITYSATGNYLELPWWLQSGAQPGEVRVEAIPFQIHPFYKQRV